MKLNLRKYFQVFLRSSSKHTKRLGWDTPNGLRVLRLHRRLRSSKIYRVKADRFFCFK